MMAEMRKRFKKENHQPITVNNFCDYYGTKASELFVAMQATDLYGKICSENRKNKIATVVPIADLNSTKQTPYQFSPKTE
jgi:hypothetical protein